MSLHFILMCFMESIVAFIMRSNSSCQSLAWLLQAFRRRRKDGCTFALRYFFPSFYSSDLRRRIILALLDIQLDEIPTT